MLFVRHHVGAQPLTHCGEDLYQQPIAGFDRVAKLRVAHDQESRIGFGRHRRARQASVQHADLAEEVPGLQRATRLAFHVDMRLAVEQDVERVPLAALCDQRVPGLCAHLIRPAGDELQLRPGKL